MTRKSSVRFQARVTVRPFRYGPVRDSQPAAMDDLRAMTSGNLSSGHVRELYGPGMIADAEALVTEGSTTMQPTITEMIQTQCPECQRINPVKAQDPRTIRPELQCAACLVCNRVYNVQQHLAPEPAPTPDPTTHQERESAQRADEAELYTTTLDERRQGYKTGYCPRCNRVLKYLKLSAPRAILCTGCALTQVDDTTTLGARLALALTGKLPPTIGGGSEEADAGGLSVVKCP